MQSFTPRVTRDKFEVPAVSLESEWKAILCPLNVVSVSGSDAGNGQVAITIAVEGDYGPLDAYNDQIAFGGAVGPFSFVANHVLLKALPKGTDLDAGDGGAPICDIAIPNVGEFTVFAHVERNLICRLEKSEDGPFPVVARNVPYLFPPV